MALLQQHAILNVFSVIYADGWLEGDGVDV